MPQIARGAALLFHAVMAQDSVVGVVNKCLKQGAQVHARKFCKDLIDCDHSIKDPEFMLSPPPPFARHSELPKPAR